jgi:hypothetical protein
VSIPDPRLHSARTMSHSTVSEIITAVRAAAVARRALPSGFYDCDPRPLYEVHHHRVGGCLRGALYPGRGLAVAQAAGMSDHPKAPAADSRFRECVRSLRRSGTGSGSSTFAQTPRGGRAVRHGDDAAAPLAAGGSDS